MTASLIALPRPSGCRLAHGTEHRLTERVVVPVAEGELAAERAELCTGVSSGAVGEARAAHQVAAIQARATPAVAGEDFAVAAARLRPGG